MTTVSPAPQDTWTDWPGRRPVTTPLTMIPGLHVTRMLLTLPSVETVPLPFVIVHAGGGMPAADVIVTL